MSAGVAPQTTLSRLLRVSAVGVAILVAATLCAAAFWLSARFDADARENARRMIEGGLRALVAGNEVVARD